MYKRLQSLKLNSVSKVLPFKISVLVFLKDAGGRFLLIQRSKEPNFGCWSPIGGKLEMDIGESPYQCAIRETFEETGHVIKESNLHLFAMVSEKAYQNQNHWLMFLFTVDKPLPQLPPSIDEGEFGFFDRAEIDRLKIPKTDQKILWSIYDQYSENFVCLRADGLATDNIEIHWEQDPIGGCRSDIDIENLAKTTEH